MAIAAPAGPFPVPGLLLGALAGLDLPGRAALVVAGAILLPSRAPGGAPPDARGGSSGWRALVAAGLAVTAVAHDAAMLALGFTTTVFGAYGLAHAGRPGRAGARAYLVLAVLGEVLLVDGLAELGHAAESSALENMRQAAGAEVGGAAMLLLGGAYGLPLALAGVRGPAPGVVALGAAALVGVLRVLPGPGGPLRDQLLAGLAVAVAGAAAALAARGLATRLPAKPVAVPAHHHGAKSSAPAGSPLPFPWAARLESKARLLTASGLTLVLFVVALYLVFGLP